MTIVWSYRTVPEFTGLSWSAKKAVRKELYQRTFSSKKGSRVRVIASAVMFVAIFVSLQVLRSVFGQFYVSEWITTGVVCGVAGYIYGVFIDSYTVSVNQLELDEIVSGSERRSDMDELSEQGGESDS